MPEDGEIIIGGEQDLERNDETPRHEEPKAVVEQPESREIERETLARILNSRAELAQISETEARSREETSRWIAEIFPDGLAEILDSRPDTTIEEAQAILARTSLHYTRNLPSNILSFIKHDSADYLNNAVSLNAGPTAAAILINGSYHQDGPNGPTYVWDTDLPKSNYGSKRKLHAVLDPTSHTVSVRATLPNGQELYNITFPGNPSEVNETNNSNFSSTEYFGPSGQIKQTRKPFEKPTKRQKKWDGRVWDYTTVLSRAANDVALSVPEGPKARGPKIKAA